VIRIEHDAFPVHLPERADPGIRAKDPVEDLPNRFSRRILRARPAQPGEKVGPRMPVPRSFQDLQAVTGCRQQPVISLDPDVMNTAQCPTEIRCPRRDLRIPPDDNHPVEVGLDVNETET